MNNSTMYNINNRKWSVFNFNDIFCIKNGFYNKKPPCFDYGTIPFIGASDSNNGFTGFTTYASIDSSSKIGYGKNEPIEQKIFEGNAICVTNNGSVGYAFYQQHCFTCTHDVNPLYLKGRKLNRHIALFLISCIEQQRVCFTYARKWRPKRMIKSKLLLPITADGTPDWLFMEEYMKQKESQILKPIIDKLCNQLIINELQKSVGGGNLLHCKWKEFVFGNEFSIESTQSGIDKNKLIADEGPIPYVTRSDSTNGIDMFICKQSDKHKVDEGNVITIGLDTQTVFYQPTKFYTGQNIQVIRHKDLDRYNAQFLIVAIKKLVDKFSWGSYGATLSRLRKSKIYLPVTDNGDIDFQFMSSFMKQIEKDILGTTLKVFGNRVDSNNLAINELGGGIWNNFYIRDLFPLMEVGRSKGLNHLSKHENGVSYLGATNQNNGVLDFVEPVDKLIQKGNCIAFIRNGEGSMGYSVYKAEDFIATSDITIGYNEHLNKYVGMFITTIADRIRGKYNFGYKRNADRLAKEILTLPVAHNGQPDWEYMEDYMRNIESKQIVAFLQKIKNQYSAV